MLAKLVAIASPSSADPRFDRSNRAVVECIAGWAESLGGHAAILPIPGESGKWNAVATFGSGEGGLVLAGHSDTVPWDDSGWDSDPFELTEKGDRLVGLGATDMKAFFPSALHAIARIDLRRLTSPIVLVATADEESGMAGARALAADGTLAGAQVVIGEPTGLVPVSMHKGVSQDRIVLQGLAGHASDPSLGVNALDAMVDVLEALVRHRASLAERHRDARFNVPAATLNLGHIEGGDNANRICGRCELHIDSRLLPGMTLARSREEVARVVREAVRDPRVKVLVEPLFVGIEPFETTKDARILVLAESITGARAIAVPFGTEAPLFQSLGKPSIVLGPGDIALAHQPNESVARADLHRAIDVYESIIASLCLSESP